ncbi:CaiB/BaiF CoA-transferase family protein [Rhabdaerophilum sp. SD176]|uniref:CaiB/BaiF CoA transferase family protein n=1 Tax=Rhabdaerophilum sp. SD176 TaxID=2983548 RepID=UPI0024E03F36|nr:CaiB/BaiF CoA-transferase family protein [Rhabdaerophilum sp. SD176]
MTGPSPLAGIRVVEFSHMVMGPSCGLVLADLGADVIKVEPAGAGDNTRRLAGSGAGFFVSFNRNKRSIALDLKSPRGLALVRRLIASADVMTENFRPGALEALGLGYEALKAENPRLIHCSLKGFLTGPYENRAALDEVVQMLGGLAYMTGPPGRPLRAGASVNDIMGGMFAAIGILAALHERQTTGLGRSVKAGLFENCIYLMSTHMMQYAVTGKPAAPMPNRLAAWAVYDVFDVADGSQVFVGVVSDTQWSAFCAAFGLEDLLADPALATNRDRVLARERFMPRLRTLFAGRSRAEILAECERIGLPFAPINRPEDMFDDPHLNHPGAMVPVTIPGGASARVPALPLEFDGKRPGLRHDIPKAGEQGIALCRELGLGEDEIEALLVEGAMTVAQA